MNRYIDERYFKCFIKDFKSVFNEIKESKGELDLRIRRNSINIYYRGNSLSKIDIRKGKYIVTINNKFLDGIYVEDRRFNERFTKIRDSSKIELLSGEIHSFFQSKYLNKLRLNIKSVDNGEEITFEQLLITDNVKNRDIIIIDRQVTETALKRRRLDLLGLKRIKENEYEFVVLEVKLGKNEEIKGAVDEQIMLYINHIENNIDDWIRSYEKTFSQYYQIGIHENIDIDGISIGKNVTGILLIGGYSGIAKDYINELKKIKSSKYSIEQFENIIGRNEK